MFALGTTPRKRALNRFVELELLDRVREGVFAILALESGPIDPQL